MSKLERDKWVDYWHCEGEDNPPPEAEEIVLTPEEEQSLSKKLTKSISTIAGIILLELNIVFGIGYLLAITAVLNAALDN